MLPSANVGRQSIYGSLTVVGVDDPVVTEEGSQPRRKGRWLGQVQQSAMNLEIAAMKCGLQAGDELAAEDTAEHVDGKEEAAGAPEGSSRALQSK